MNSLSPAAQAVLQEARNTPWRLGSPVFRCTKPEHGNKHPGSLGGCVYTFQGWYGDDDDPDSRYFSRFVSQSDPPREIIGSDDSGPQLSYAQAEAITASVNAYARDRERLAMARGALLMVKRVHEFQLHSKVHEAIDKVLAALGTEA